MLEELLQRNNVGNDGENRLLGIQAIFEDAGVRPGCRSTFVSAKVAKTIDAPSGHIRWDGRQPWEGGPTRYAQTRPAWWYERPSGGQDGRRRKLGSA